MKDIDRNINSLLYSKINSLESSAFNIDFSKYQSIYTKRVDENINDTQINKSIVKRLAYPAQVLLDAGDYYYLHTLQPVSSDNTQCLFSLSLENNVSRPFFHTMRKVLSKIRMEKYIMVIVLRLQNRVL